MTKQEFGNLIKSNFLWPGYNWRLISTSNGLEGSTNEYLDGVIEIIIDVLYQKYSESQNLVNIFDVLTTDSDKEIVALKCSNHSLGAGTKIRIYGTNFYNGEYTILENTSSDQDYIWIGQSYVPEVISNTAYYTVLSDDWYTEGEPRALSSESSVINIDNPQNPIYLPLIGLDLGYVYSDRRTVAQNRKLIQRSIPFYKIKGTNKSITILMNLLGYDCDIVEPFKYMLKYGISKYDSEDHYQDWAYYHDGVFEIVTDGISLDKYQKSVKQNVQLAGTRLVSRANMNLGLVPIVGEILYSYSNSYFIESVIKAFKAGNIYDTITHSQDRTKSGNLELSGIYLDLSVDIGSLTSFRRIWDTGLFTFDDVAEPIIDTIPANTFSVVRGAYSGQVQVISGYESPYTEKTPFDLQLPIDVIARSERPAIRSEYCNKRSGSNSRSGLDGSSWLVKPAFILDFNDPVSMEISRCENIIELSSNLDTGYIPDSSHYGNILDVNDSYSGVRSLYGFELALGYRQIDIEDWADKLYWSWDDVVVRSDMTSNSLEWNSCSIDIVKETSIIEIYSTEEKYSSNSSLSGYLQCHDIQIQITN